MEGKSAIFQSPMGVAYGNMRPPSSGTDTGVPSGVVLAPVVQHPAVEGCVLQMLLTAGSVAICCQITLGLVLMVVSPNQHDQ